MHRFQIPTLNREYSYQQNDKMIRMFLSEDVLRATYTLLMDFKGLLGVEGVP